MWKRCSKEDIFLASVAWANQALAQIGVGTWERTDPQGKSMTMTVESPMDGTEVEALVGEPSGETMAIRRVDDRHYTAVVKMSGQPFGTSSGTLAQDGRSLTVESTTESAGVKKKVVETWVRK